MKNGRINCGLRIRNIGKRGWKMTNFERIKGMNVEELADFLFSITNNCSDTMCENQFCNDDCCPGYCGQQSCLEWLESECGSE